MIGRPWRYELLRVAAGGIALAGLGALFGHPAAFALCGLLLWGGWHGVQIYRLADWLRNGKRGARPTARGPWREIYTNLDNLQRKNRKKKKRLASIINRFAQVAAAVPDATVVLKDRDVISWFNPAAVRLFALTAPQDLGQPLSNLVRAPELADYLADGDFERPLEIDAPGDRGMRLLLRVVPYGDDRRLLVARDVTRLTRLEEMRRDFVANVSHELRTPLTVISGYIEGMEDEGDTLPAQWRRPVEVMAQQTLRMRTIVDDLLQLSQLENKASPPPLETVDIGALLRAVESEARSVSRGRHLFVVAVDEQVALLGERSELYSAFSNIVLNAVRYTPEGGRINIDWSASEDSGAMLSVVDTGLGIEPQHIERLTERFYRVDRARSRESGGTGLGLAIVKHVLARHEARMEVDSEPGRGSTFRCLFGSARVQTQPTRSRVTQH